MTWLISSPVCGQYINNSGWFRGISSPPFVGKTHNAGATEISRKTPTNTCRPLGQLAGIVNSLASEEMD